MRRYRQAKNTKVYIFGFSFGALIALMASVYLNPTKLYLCSLSPFFQDDIKKNGEKDLAILGKRRSHVLRTIQFSKVASAIKCPTIIIAGDSELTSVIHRAQNAAKEIRSSRLYLARASGHNLLDQGYDKVLKHTIK
jgi:pimeloyl-ACP methyl ester carboxylesterase